MTALSVTCVTEATNVVEIKDLQKINIRNTSTSLDSLIEKGLNSTSNSDGVLKSRRKRYVAFPEGSSFSVKEKKNKYNSVFLSYAYSNFRLRFVRQLVYKYLGFSKLETNFTFIVFFNCSTF